MITNELKSFYPQLKLNTSFHQMRGRMRKFMRLDLLFSNASSNYGRVQLSKFQIQHHCFSALVRKSKISSSLSTATKETDLQKDSDVTTFTSLFNEITQILGAENVTTDGITHGFLIPRETHMRNSHSVEDHLLCTPTVREISSETILHEKKNTQLEISGDMDVSPVVHEITNVIHSENGPGSMEERLGSLEVNFNSEIVEKVLKRCFKIPLLAIRFFNWVKLRDGFSHTTKIFNTMLSISGEAKDFELVEILTEEMEKNSFEKDIKTWTILITLYGNAKMIGKTLLVYNNMKKFGCEPDAIVYNTIICTLCSAGRPEIAMEFYKETVQKGIGLDMRTYKALLNCLVSSGDIASVFSVSNEMVTVGQICNNDVHHHVLKSLCIFKRIREALEFIRDLKNKGIALGPEYFEILVKGLCNADRISDALEIVDIMKKKDLIGGNVYGIIINWYLKINDVVKALALFQEMKESGHLPTTSIYTQLIQHSFKSRDFQKGFDLYHEMVEKGVEFDSVAVMAVVSGYVQQDRVNEAWEVFKTMESKGIKPNAKFYLVFIKELSKVSKTEETIKILLKMKEAKIAIPDRLLNSSGKCSDTLDPSRISRLVVDPLQSISAYKEEDLQEICKILSSSTRWAQIEEELEKSSVLFTPELVLEVLRKCNMHGFAALHFFTWVGKKPGYRNTTETYNMAIKLAGQGKDFKHMRHLFYEMRRNNCLINSETWTVMIMLYGRIGLTKIALKVFEEMKGSSDSSNLPSGKTYKYMIISLCGKKGRKVEEAVRIFREMIRAGFIPDKELIEIYLLCLCEVGKLSEARKCMDYLCKVGFTVPLSYSLHIRALFRAGKLDEALALVDETGNDRFVLDQYIYGSLVHGLLQSGRLEEALNKVSLMKQAGVNPTIHVYTSLIVYFFRENQIRRALQVFGKMMQEGCEPTIVTYSAIIQGYMKWEKYNEAWNVFHYIKENGPLPDFKTYSMFITCLCKAGKSEEGLEILSEMMNSGIAPSTVNFRTVFFGLNREGKKNLACHVLQQKAAFTRHRKFLT